MFKKIYCVIKIITGLTIGIGFGFLILLFIANLSLNFDSQLYKTLGIKKPQIIGFQPFWLLQKADKPYEKYTNIFTYFSLTLDTDGTIVKLVNLQEEEPGWTTLKSGSFQEKLQQAKNNNLKLSLLIHNSNEASISALLKEPEKHAQNLVNDAISIMQKYSFTDLNLDIESFEVASESAQQQYTAFIKEVKSEIDKNNLGTLTVEVPPISLVQPRLINVEEIAKIADSIVFMAYDFHYIYSYIAGPVAPIGGVDTVREFDVATVLKEALNVVPQGKIILGIPLYGYEWETISNKPGAPTIPSGSATASNRRIAELLASCNNCTKAYDEQAKQPYVIFQDGDYFHQIYYENEQSLAEKLKLAKEHKIAGVALWALGYEGEKILEPLKAYKKLFYFDPSLSIIN